VNARLRDEWGIAIGSIPEDRLRDEIEYASRHDVDVCVKIPSRSEFSMSLDEAQAVLAALRGER
jgi:hypothetical protein